MGTHVTLIVYSLGTLRVLSGYPRVPSGYPFSTLWVPKGTPGTLRVPKGTLRVLEYSKFSNLPVRFSPGTLVAPTVGVIVPRQCFFVRFFEYPISGTRVPMY